MGKIAFLFSGQGEQYPGMGKTLWEQYPSAAKVFGMCDEIRPGTSEQCFSGTEEELMETKNTQPCLFAMELAAARVLQESGIRPEAVAGYSLGEVAACTVAGVVDDQAGFRLVCKRGELMQKASEAQDTSMAVVLKLTQEQVEDLCAQRQQVYPVNFNCPGQITVSGLTKEMPTFFAEVKAVGGRTMPLKVRGAFHSPFMAQAAEEFGLFLQEVQLQQPKLPLYSNVTAKRYSENVGELLARQISSPVRWEALIREMLSDGFDTFIEVGPGKTLTTMMGRIDKTVRCYSVSDMEQVLREAGGC